MRNKKVAITQSLMAEMRLEFEWRRKTRPDEIAETIADQVMDDFGLIEAPNIDDERYVKIRKQIVEGVK